MISEPKGLFRMLLDRLGKRRRASPSTDTSLLQADQAEITPRRTSVARNVQGNAAATVEFSPAERPVIRLQKGADAATLLNASVAIFAQTISEQDRRTFASWTGIPLPWSQAHDDLFAAAYAHVAWESEAPVFKSARSLVPRPGTPLSVPISPEARGVLERMMGA